MKTLFTLIAAISLMHTLSAQPGTLDKSFGDNGKVISETYQGLAYASLLQQDGKIVVGGSGTYYKNGKLLKGSLLARYNTDGSPDLSFADSGRGVYILGDTGSWVPTIRAMALQPDGKIIALGNFAVQNGVFAPFSLMRFNSDGSPDKSFGINGLTIGYISGGLDAPNDVALLSDDRIVIAGDLHKDINDVGRSFIACYTTNGVLDQSFGNGGIVTIAFAIDQLLTINAIAITKDDKIIVGGEYGFGANNTLLRYNNDGTQDLSFGENGLAQIFFDKKFSSVILNDIAISEDDNIITTGEVYFNSPKIAIEANRFNKIGKPDSSFGTNGYTYTEYSKGNSYGNCIAIQQNGKIIAAGYQAQGDSGTFTMVRYETDGSIDASFGEDGIQNTFFYGEDIAYAASIQNDGKIILVGSSQLETTSTVDIARYNNDGTQTPKQVIFAKIRRWWQHHNGIMWNNVPGIKNYAIQRSGDGAHWSTVYSASINHSPLSGNNYYNDAAPLSGDNYYRLQTTSVTGAVNYSNVIAINNTAIKISPNPAKNVLHVEGLPKDKKVKLSVIDLTGTAKMQTIANSVPLYNINIASLHPGNYLLKIESSGDVVTKQFVKE